MIFHAGKSPTNIIIGDEMWVYGYHAKTKQKTSHWKTSASPNPKRA
jgi:hypothetical protein